MNYDIFTITLFLSAIIAMVIAVLFLVRQKKAGESLSHSAVIEILDRNQERTERLLREEMAQNRGESSRQAQCTREELTGALKGFGDSLQKQMMDVSALQENHMVRFSRQFSETTERNENKFESLRDAVDRRLQEIQADNALKLEQMRSTVEEKLQGTLEKRLGESFRLVSERLEQVHQGLGDMRKLAAGVGDLKRVLTNVKARGGWGEVQLEMLLDDMLTPDQFQRNVQTKDDSGETVEFAVKLPGQGGSATDHVWLPIDAKFPLEDFQRLVEAQERAESESAAEAGKMLEIRIKACAKDICIKYLNPPVTTDFAVMFLPTEGLYAEVVKRTMLTETIRKDFHVIIAGPSTFAALLNSLQMGFRTLAIQKRSGEIWSLLGAVKTEFGKFGATLEQVKKKLEQATNTMDSAARRSRAIERKLQNIQELPAEETRQFLSENSSEGE